MSGRFSGEEVDPGHVVVASGLFFRGFPEAIEPVGNLKIDQADLPAKGAELRLRQSAGYSAGPKIDVAPGLFRQVFFQGDVGDVDLPAGAKDPDDLRVGLELIGGEV